MKELNRTSWISSGTERKMSSTKPIGRLTQTGVCARVSPKTTPSSVPAVIEIAVISSVQPAPQRQEPQIVEREAGIEHGHQYRNSRQASSRAPMVTTLAIR